MSLTAEPRVREEDKILHRAEPQFPARVCACVSANMRRTSSYMFHVRVFRCLQTYKCFGCVSGYSGRGSESPTLKSETKGRRKRRKVLHANQQLREAEPWTMSSDVDFHGRKLGSTKSYLIGIRWHGLATIWKWREITPSAFLLHVILVHIHCGFLA